MNKLLFSEMTVSGARLLFWKIMAIIAILLWIATLYTWYVIKTTPPRYIKSDSLVIDTKENKVYNPYNNSWEIWNPDIK